LRKRTLLIFCAKPLHRPAVISYFLFLQEQIKDIFIFIGQFSPGRFRGEFFAGKFFAG
jgi:hypothetical protein